MLQGMSDNTEKPTSGVHQQILDKFLKELQESGIPASVIERLRTVVASEEVSDMELKKAMFAEDKEV